MIEETFGMIKPEGIKYKKDIETRIINIGLEIESKKTFLTEQQFEKIYGHVKDKIPDIYGSMKYYMTSNPVILIHARGTNAKTRLMELRGASNASEAKKGTIRGDYAKDQDYRTIYAEKKIAKNVFHAADASDAEEMVKMFFGEKR